MNGNCIPHRRVGAGIQYQQIIRCTYTELLSIRAVRQAGNFPCLTCSGKFFLLGSNHSFTLLLAGFRVPKAECPIIVSYRQILPIRAESQYSEFLVTRLAVDGWTSDALIEHIPDHY